MEQIAMPQLTAIFRFKVLSVSCAATRGVTDMRSYVILAFGLLAACSSAGAQEEERYRMIERSSNGDSAALCKAAGEVATAYLQDRDDAKYSEWSKLRRLKCVRAIADDHYIR